MIIIIMAIIRKVMITIIITIVMIRRIITS